MKRIVQDIKIFLTKILPIVFIINQLNWTI